MKLDEIALHLEEAVNSGKKIVHCHGCFDLLHHGHIKHFEAAKKFGDVLVVSLTEDRHVNKGPDRPFFNHNIRAQNIAALEVVDFVAINYHPTAITAIEAIKPNYFVKGQDYKNIDEDVTGGILVEKNEVERHGGQLVFTEEVQFSSSHLINKFFDQKDETAKAFLTQIKDKYSHKDFVSLFDQISKNKVLIIGDIIMDAYQFVNPIGKASKSPTITATQENLEVYAGGVLAVANHVADFVEEVILVTTFGENRDLSYWEAIQDNLHDKVKLVAIETPNHPTVVKSRIISKVFRHKLFEIIEINQDPLEEEVEKKLIDALGASIKEVDLCLVADFGHGVLTERVIEFLQGNAPYLAVNAQTNSANLGYNLLTKYSKCDYFSIDKAEAHLALHERRGEIQNLQKRLMEKTNAKFSSITLGVNGTSVMNTEQRVVSPIFNTDVVDTIGAGDAYLSITSLLAQQGASIEEIAFVGNAVGAMAVKIIGNKSYIQRTDLLKYIKTLLA